MTDPEPNAAPEVRCITVVFKTGGRKYDYKSINPDIKVGDAVVVEVRGKEKTAWVVGTTGKLLDNPPFAYKWIIRLKSKEEKEND